MAVISLSIPEASRQLIRRHAGAAAKCREAIGGGLLAAAGAGAERVSDALLKGELDLRASGGAEGLAGAVGAWMIDPEIPMAALGVPSNAPAARYAAILEYGGTITPKSARALSVPVSDEAKRHSSPRDMTGLFMVKRRGRPPLLAESIGKRGILIHWVLLGSVTIRARHWLTRGAAAAEPAMAEAMADRLNEYARTWNEG